jgi:hypothetical protein
LPRDSTIIVVLEREREDPRHGVGDGDDPVRHDVPQRLINSLLKGRRGTGDKNDRLSFRPFAQLAGAADRLSRRAPLLALDRAPAACRKPIHDCDDLGFALEIDADVIRVSISQRSADAEQALRGLVLRLAERGPDREACSLVLVDKARRRGVERASRHASRTHEGCSAPGALSRRSATAVGQRMLDGYAWSAARVIRTNPATSSGIRTLWRRSQRRRNRRHSSGSPTASSQRNTRRLIGMFPISVIASIVA